MIDSYRRRLPKGLPSRGFFLAVAEIRKFYAIDQFSARIALHPELFPEIVEVDARRLRVDDQAHPVRRDCRSFGIDSGFGRMGDRPERQICTAGPRFLVCDFEIAAHAQGCTDRPKCGKTAELRIVIEHGIDDMGSFCAAKSLHHE